MFRGGGSGLEAFASSVLCFVTSTLLVFLLSLILALTVIRCYDVFRQSHQVSYTLSVSKRTLHIKQVT